jgi:hypothetical protein
VDGGCVGIELAVIGELLLSESQRGVEHLARALATRRAG